MSKKLSVIVVSELGLTVSLKPINGCKVSIQQKVLGNIASVGRQENVNLQDNKAKPNKAKQAAALEPEGEMKDPIIPLFVQVSVTREEFSNYQLSLSNSQLDKKSSIETSIRLSELFENDQSVKYGRLQGERADYLVVQRKSTAVLWMDSSSGTAKAETRVTQLFGIFSSLSSSEDPNHKRTALQLKKIFQSLRSFYKSVRGSRSVQPRAPSTIWTVEKPDDPLLSESDELGDKFKQCQAQMNQLLKANFSKKMVNLRNYKPELKQSIIAQKLLDTQDTDNLFIQRIAKLVLAATAFLRITLSTGTYTSVSEFNAIKTWLSYVLFSVDVSNRVLFDCLIDTVVYSATTFKHSDLKFLLETYASIPRPKSLLEMLGVSNLTLDLNWKISFNYNPNWNLSLSTKTLFETLALYVQLDRPSTLVSSPNPTEPASKALEEDFARFVELLMDVDYKIVHQLFDRVLNTLNYAPSHDARQFYFAFIQQVSENDKWRQCMSYYSFTHHQNEVFNACHQEAISCKISSELKSMISGPITQVMVHAKITDRFPTLLRRIGDGLTANNGTEEEAEIMEYLLSLELLTTNDKLDLIKNKLEGSIVRVQSPYGKLILKIFEFERPYPCDKRESEVTWSKFLSTLHSETKGGIFSSKGISEPMEEMSRYQSKDSDDSVFHKLTERLHHAVWNNKMSDTYKSIPVVYYCRLLETYSKKIIEDEDIPISHLLKLNNQPMITLLEKFANCPEIAIKKKISDFHTEYEDLCELITERIKFLGDGSLREYFNDMDFHRKALNAATRIDSSKEKYTVKSLPETENFKEVKKLSTEAMKVFSNLSKHPQYMALLKKGNNLSTTEGFSASVLGAQAELHRRLVSMAGKDLTLSLADIETYFSSANDTNVFLKDLGLSETDSITINLWVKRLNALKNLIPVFMQDSVNSFFKWKSLAENKDKSKLAVNLGSMQKNLLAISPDLTAITAHNLSQADPTNICGEVWVQQLDPNFLQVLSSSEPVFEFLQKDQMDKIIQNLMNECDPQYVGVLESLQTIQSECAFLIKASGGPVEAAGDDILHKVLQKNRAMQTKLSTILGRLNIDLGTLRLLLVKLTGEFKKLVEGLVRSSIFVIQYDPEKDQFELAAEPLVQAEGGEQRTQAQDHLQKLQDAKGVDKKLVYTMYDLKDYFTQARILYAEHTRDKDIAQRDESEMAEGGERQSEVKELIASFKKLGDYLEDTLHHIEDIRALGLINKTFTHDLVLRIKTAVGETEYGHLFAGTENGSRLVFLVNNQREQCLNKLNEFLVKVDKGIRESIRKTLTGGDQQSSSMQLMTYFVGQKMFHLIEFMMLDPSKRNSRECLNTITLLEQANDGNEFGPDSKDKIKKLEYHYLEERVGKAASILDESRLPFEASRFIEDEERSILSKNLVTIIKVEANRCVINGFDLILKIFNSLKGSQQLLITDILYCKPNTSHFEINAFLLRCFRDTQKRVYIILNPADLIKDSLNYLLERIDFYLPSSTAEDPDHSKADMVNNRLLIFSNTKEQENFSNPKLFHTVDPQAINAFKQYVEKGDFKSRYTNKLSTIKLVKSEHASEGKSHFIAKDHMDRVGKGKSRLIELSLSGEINQAALAERLEALNKAAKSNLEEGNLQFDLHIKLDYVERLSQWSLLIDWMLFNFCFLRMHHTDSGIRSYKEQIGYIYIELGNSEADIKLSESLWTIELLQRWNSPPETKSELRFHLVENIPCFKDCTKIDFNKSPSSDEQVVAKYLQEYQKQRFVVGTSTSQEKVSEGEYQKLLREGFMEVFPKAEPEKVTFGSFKFWLKTVARLKRGLDARASRLQNNNVDCKCQFLETSQEIKSTAIKILRLQDDKASWSQDQVMKIVYPANVEPGNDDDAERKTDEENNKIIMSLDEKMKNTKWDTTNLYLPIISDKSFLPVYSNPSSFTEVESTLPKMDVNEETQVTVLRRLATKVISNNITSDFEKLVGEGENNSSLQYAYRLAVMLSDFEDKDAIIAKYNSIAKSIEGFSDQKEDVESAGVSTINKKGFSITEEVFHKLVLMYFKAEIKSPIVIMGESGCGKTYLTQFLVKSLLEDMLMMETLHSGYPEKRLIVFILNAIKKAKELQGEGKKLWMFFDEFNTTAIQSVIADTILDRTCPKLGSLSEKEFNEITQAIGIQDLGFNELPELEKAGIQDNMLFIACCNPFCIKLKKNTADIGLVPNEKSSLLSHIVHPIPKRLLALVWDFGMLSDEHEATHIRNQVQNQDFFFTEETGKEPTQEERKLIGRSRNDIRKKRNTQFALLAKSCHRIVRKAEERSGVSLRDTNRLYIFFRWFSKQFKKIAIYLKKHQKDPECPKLWMLATPQLQDIGAAICTMTLCYGLRLNGQKESEELYECITNWANSVSKLRLIDKSTEVETALCQVARVFLHPKKNVIPADTALNRPLLENYITLLACYAVKIPMIIIGAPGTSKTLSTSLFLSFLSPENRSENDELYDELPDANVIYYSGSQTSTAEAVERVFNKAESQYKKQIDRLNSTKDGDPKGKLDRIKTQVIFFDELGLAELSPHNPLKVMHSHLEKNIGKVMFIGVSNWKPDQSKLNRMISLSRPDLEESDLLDIFNSLLDDLKIIKENEKKLVREMISCLPAAYLKFRKWQKSLALKKKHYHSNFHGSRDIYGTYNVFKQKIMHSLKYGIDKTDVAIQKDAFRIISEAIERNLNGELYIFGPEDLSTTTFNIDQDEGNQPDHSTMDFFHNKLIKHDIFSDDKFRVIRLDALEDVYYQKKYQSRKGVVCLTSSQVMKMLFLQQLDSRGFANCINTFIKDNFIDRSVEDLVNESISSEKSRFLMIRTESLIIEDIFIDKLRWKLQGKTSNPDFLIDWRTSEGSQVDDRLILFKNYVTKGYTVVMKNQDDLYGALYELFNQKYTDNNGKRTCNLYDGEMRHRVEVHKDFKCIVILSASMTDMRSKDLEKKQPAPFLNRFEKYYVHMESIIPSTDLKRILKLREVACKMANGNTLNLVGLNLDLITSLVVRKAQEKYLNDRQMKLKLLQLATANSIMMNEENIIQSELESAKSDQENKNKEEFTLNSLLDLIVEPVEGQANNYSKLILMTFSKPAEVPLNLKDSYSFSVIRVSKISWRDIHLNKGLLDAETCFNGNLALIFENPSDLDHLYYLRNLVDKLPNVTSVLFLVHMSKYSFERRKLRENNGISFYNNWDVRVIDKLDGSFSYSDLIKVKNQSLLNAVLNVQNDESNPNSLSNNFSQITNEVVRQIIINKWEHIVKESEVAAPQKNVRIPVQKSAQPKKVSVVEANVGHIYSMLGNPNISAAVMPSIKQNLKIYIDMACAESPNIRDIQLTDAVKKTLSSASNKLVNDEENYKEVAQMLSFAMIKFFEVQIVDFFNKLNTACHNFYTRLIGLQDCLQLKQQHALRVQEACVLASKQGQFGAEVVNTPSLVKCFYSPLTPEDLQLMGTLADMNKLVDEGVCFRKTDLTLLLREYSRIRAGNHINKSLESIGGDKKILDGLLVDITREELKIRKTVEEIQGKLILADNDDLDPEEMKPLSFKEEIIEINNDQSERPKSEIVRLVADVLKFIFEKRNSSYFGFNNKITYLEGFIELCRDLIGNINEHENFKDQSQLVKILSVALELCYCFETTVKGYFELLQSGQTTKNVTDYIKKHCGEKETNKRVLINMQALEALQQFIAVHIIPNVEIFESKESLDLLRRNINISDIYKNEYKEVVNLIICMISNIDDQGKKQNQLSELQALNLNKEERQILPALLQLGNKIFVEFLTSRANPPKVTEKFTESMLKLWREETCHWTQHFVRVWSWQQISFDMLIDEQYSQLYNVFSEDEMLLIMMGVSPTVDKFLGKADSAENVTEILKKVSYPDKEQNQALRSLQKLVQKWAEPGSKKGLHNLLLKALHDNIVSSALKYPNDPKKRPNVYSWDSFKLIVDAFLNWNNVKSNQDEKAKDEKTIETASTNSDPKINLKLLVASACYWITLSDPTFDSVKLFDPLELLNDLYKLFLVKTDPDSILESSNGFPFVCLMQKTMAQDNRLTDVATKMELARSFEEGMKDELDYSKIAILDANLIPEYNAISIAVEDGSSEATESGKATKLAKLITGNKANPMKIYFIGLMVINEFLKPGFNEERAGEYKKAFTSARSIIGVNDTMESKICLFVLNILNTLNSRIAVKLINKEDLDFEFKFKKVTSHLALLVLAFPSSNLKYKRNDWKSWTNGILQDNLYLKICLEGKMQRSTIAIRDVLMERMSQNSSNIALYMCNCGFFYNYDACGYGEKLYSCAYCNRQIGAMSHAHQMMNENYMKVEPPNVKDLKKYQMSLEDSVMKVKTMYEANKIYVGHCEFDEHNPTYSIVQLLEIPLSEYLKKSTPRNGTFDDKLIDELRNNTHMKHLLDHLYLTALPMLIEPTDLPTFNAAVEKSIKYQPPTNGPEKVFLLQKPSDKTKNGPVEDYFIMHLANDLKAIELIIQCEGPLKTLEWLLAVEANMFDMLVKNKQPDAKSGLLIEARAFIKANDIIKEQASQLNLMMNIDPDCRPAKIRDLLHRRRLQSDICANPVEKKYLALYDSLRIDRNMYSFPLVEHEFESRQALWLPLLNKCNRLMEMLVIFPKMMGTAMDLIRHVQMTYSGMISFEKARDAKFMCEGSIRDERLRLLYKRFQEVWNKVKQGKFQYKFPEIFDLQFMCQQGLEFDDFFSKLLSDSEVRLSYFVMLDYKDYYANKETIIMGALVRTMMEKVHNNIIKDINFLSQQLEDSVSDQSLQLNINREREMQAITIKDAFEKDFTGLSLDFKKLLMEHSGTNPKPQSGSAFIVDIFTLQTTCANEMTRKEILCENDHIFNFKFIEGVGADHRLDVMNQLKRVRAISIDQSILEKLNSNTYKEEAEVMGLLYFLCKLCDYLFVSLNLESDSTETLHDKLELEGGINEEMESRKKEHLDHLVKLEFDPNLIQIGMLKPIYELVIQKHFDLYLSKFNDRLSQAIATDIENAYQGSTNDTKNEFKLIMNYMRESINTGYKTDNMLAYTIKPSFPDSDAEDAQVLKLFETVKLGHYLHLREIIPDV